MTSWDDIAQHLTKKKFHSDDVKMKFLNQIHGKTANNISIDSLTSNKVDLGIQCSVFVLICSLCVSTIDLLKSWIEDGLYQEH